MKIEIPAISFVRGFKVDNEPILRFKDGRRSSGFSHAEFERSLLRPWNPRRPIDRRLDTSERVRK